MSKKEVKFSKHSDSYLTHCFARSVSVHITPLLGNTRITPLQITIAGLILGLCAAGIGSINSWNCGILAAVLIETSHVLDCVDGELYRLTGRGSSYAGAMDPISDRIKDTAMLIAAYVQSVHRPPFNLSVSSIAIIALATMGLWLCYMYIVDAFLNPARKHKKDSVTPKKIYLGLYDLFIYGSIILLLINYFNYFIIFVLLLSASGVIIQIVRLKKALMP